MAETVDPFTRSVEEIIEQTIEIAVARNMLVVLATEEWGRGGPLGIDQWIGLGERRGIWKRALRVTNHMPTKIVHINARTWRSHMIDETGDRSSGTFVAYDTDGWKRAATRVYTEVFDAPPPIETADAAEAALLGAYAIRSNEVLKVLGVRYLAAHGFEASAEYVLPPESTKRQRKERADVPKRALERIPSPVERGTPGNRQDT